MAGAAEAAGATEATGAAGVAEAIQNCPFDRLTREVGC